MQSGFWKADWFLGVLVVALFALFNSMSDLVPSLERKAYDAALAAAELLSMGAIKAGMLLGA